MITIFFIVTTVVTLIGWLFYWMGSAALAKYILKKGYKPPSDKEMKACCVEVLKNLFHVH